MTNDETNIEILIELMQRQHGNKYSRELLTDLYHSTEKIIDMARMALTCPVCIKKIEEKYGKSN